MENTLYIALSRQMVMDEHMAIIANNIANASTSGYKGEQLMFVEYLADLESGGEVSFVQDLAVVRDFSEGAFSKTGNPLDVAIDGDGWFVVDTPQGNLYTRNGHFALDGTGRLVTSAGYAVLDANGVPINFKTGETDIQISTDGTITTSAGTKGRLNVVTFADTQLLSKAADSLYTTDQPPTPALGVSVVQGMIEGSNVEPIIEMSNMIYAMRSYQAAQEVVLMEDGRLRQVIETLTQTQA